VVIDPPASAFRAILLPALLLLAGCAARPVAPEAPDYTPGADYHLLMAEIALERGEYRTVVEQYLAAAGQSDLPEIAIRATELAFGFGYDAAALAAASRWLELEPGSLTAQLVLARLHMRRNDLEAAIFHAVNALDRGGLPPRDEDYQVLAFELGQDGDARLTSRLLARLAARDPLSGRLQLLLGDAALRAGEPALALYAGQSAALDDPDWAEPQLLIARALLGLGQREQALALGARLVEEQPGLAVELEYARLLSLADRQPDARRTLRRLAITYGEQPEITRLLAFVNLQGGNYTAAFDQFSELLNQGYNTGEAFYYLAQIAATEGSTGQALRLYEQVAEGPFLLPSRFAMAGLRAGEGSLETAVGGLEAFVSRSPQYAFEVAEFLAALYTDAGDVPAALAQYDLALTFKPELARLHLGRGTLLEGQGQLNEALAALRRALELAPDNPVMQNALGYTLADHRRQLREADRLVRLALEQAPDSAAIIDSMGWVRYRQGRLPEARSWLMQAWNLQRDDEIGAHLGEVLWRLGERDAARAVWAEALELFPDSPLVAATLRRLDR